ncbi:MAG: glycosyltransferase family 4 protein [Chlorobium sp.]|nr:MAG: glycosyltransferase family 4 protein [Chlorobium sp.]
MRVAFVHTDFRLYWPARVKALDEFLKEKGVTLSVVEIAGKGSPYSFDNVSNKQLFLDWCILFPDEAMEQISPDKAVRAVIDKLNKIKPDVVFAGAVAFPSGAAAIRWCLLNRKPVIIFDNARLEDVPRAFYINWAKKQLYRLVDAMLIPASSHVSTFRYFGLKTEQLFFGINCVDNQFFSDQANIFSSLTVPHNHPYLLAIGRQVRKKNWAKLISAYIAVRKTDPPNPFDLLFIGDGPEHDVLMNASGDEINRSIHFLPFKSQQELCVYYKHAEGLVLPSLYGETWGLVVNEAMASGLPVLVSGKCGCAETLVKHENNGFVFEPEDQTLIADVLEKFMSMSHKQRKAMGEISKNIIDEWGFERFCKGVWKAIEFVCSENKRSGTLSGKIISNFWNGRYNPT